MIYRIHVRYEHPEDGTIRYFECFEDTLEYLDTLSVRDDLSDFYVQKINNPNWLDMTEAF